ncbi:unnamed protein product [Plutella xylostella]|uniref:(diamondback moth) hypothetical protein n=1 Tax=Plutella xylostella TaxID=51655 RepID=A0A8S4FYW8_PLUXY|nr:unnamed protein product [Plutella xylostella]
MANNSDKIDNSELKLLIKKRGSCKAQLTQFETFLSRLDGCDGLSELLKTELGIRMKKIELLQSDFDKLQCEIELLSDNVDEAYADRDQFESKLFRLLSVAHGLLAAAARYPAAGAPGGTGRATLPRNAVEEVSSGCPKLTFLTSMAIISTGFHSEIPLVKVADKHGSLHTARLLLDNGSTSNFVTESLCEKLDLKRYNASSTVSGINNHATSTTESCDLAIQSYTDASERAYGSCVYIRTIRNDGTAHVCLLTSKNKVAPIKPNTIPRLELCGALLGTRLCKKVLDSLTVKIDQCYYWSDSTIVLGWLNTATYRLERFVRNRVNEIQQSTAGDTWSYVPSKQNPADLVSRGVKADLIMKAVHIELVSSLTKEAYLAALNRFMARRGRPQTIYSDHGSNFIGGFNELSDLFRNSLSDIPTILSHDEIDFKFIPPYSPHFGGIWEAAVKSVKHHLRRVLALAHLTYEEMITCLNQIEAILNSRPLTPLSSDPSDLSFLSPSHFLIGRPLTSVPYPQVSDCNVHRLDRFQRIEFLRQHFWKRYCAEYVTLLQQKTKWLTSTGHLQVGSLVLVKDKTQPPLMWLMGRIVQLHPGKDGVSRVADIETKRGIIQRAYNNICPLPLDC